MIRKVDCPLSLLVSFCGDINVLECKMAYAQWVEISIESKTGSTLSIKNAQHACGKFFKNNNKDEEISPDDINKIQIPSGDKGIIASCGREDAASGTEGSFDIYDGETKVGNYYWDCPWGSKSNQSTWTSTPSENYITEVTGGNSDSGALGNVYIKCGKFPS